MKYTFLQKDTVKQFDRNDSKSNLFNLENWLKKAFNFFNVPYVDPCCEPTSSTSLRFNKDGNFIEYYDYNTSNWVSGININENTVSILKTNNYNDFQKAHGSLLIGHKLYIATRDADINKLVYYPNVEDLSKFQSISSGLTGGPDMGLSSLTFASSSNKIYSTLPYGKTMLIANADDINDYSIVSIALSGTLKFAVSNAIVNDDTYIYTGGVDGSTPYIIKIRISDLAVISTSILTGFVGTFHTGVLDSTNTYGYFTTSNDAKLVKITLSSLAQTYITLPFSLFTDDMCFVPGDPGGFPFPYNDLIFLGSETRNFAGNTSGIVVDVDALTYSVLDILPTFALTYDSVNKRILSTSLKGYIEVLSLDKVLYHMDSPDPVYGAKFLTDTYTIRGNVIPNEIMLADNGDIYITDWNNLTSNGKLMKIKLNKVDNPIITKQEAAYRFN